MRRWVGFVAITMVMGGCSVNELCEAFDELCVDDGLGDGGDGPGWPGDDDGMPPGEDGGDDGMEPPDDWGDEGGEPPIDPCLEEYEWCLAEMGGESCDEILQWCEPPEPPEPDPCADAFDACFFEFDACMSESPDPTECEANLDACFTEADLQCGWNGDGGMDDGGMGDGGTGPIDQCFEEADACFLASEDPEICDQLLEACLGAC